MLSTLPFEIQWAIVQYLSPNDLCSLRLVSKSISDLAVRLLFASLKLEINAKSGSSLLAVAKSATLSPYVRTVTLDTRSVWRNAIIFGSPTDSSLESPEVVQALDVLWKFENLATFNMPLDVIGWRQTNGHEDRISRFDQYHTQLFEGALEGLNKRTPKYLRRLHLTNPPGQQSTFTNGPSLASALDQIEDLSIKIAWWDQSEANPGLLLLFETWLAFFVSLPNVWLAPGAKNLTKLTLDVKSQLWGYAPRVDFRNIKLPRLHTLDLGHFSFSHDWQLKWLTQLKTLQHLVLNACVIVTHVEWEGKFDEDGYPIMVRPDSNSESSFSTHSYKRRWSDYLNEIAISCGCLRSFVMDDRDLCNTEMHHEPRSAEYQEKPWRLSPQRYVAFEHGLWFCSYESTSAEQAEDLCYEDDQTKDEQALRLLQETVTKRRMDYMTST